MSDPLKLIRQELLTIKPFDTTRIGFEHGLLLDANESPWDNWAADGVQLNRYIDGMNDLAILEPLAHYYQVSTSQLLLTRGSCEGIDLLVRAFCRAYQDAVLVCPPTFSIFAQCAQIQGAKVVKVPLLKEHNFRLDPTAVLNSITPDIKLVFICTPNNPTGNLVPVDDILTIVKALAGKAMVIVDEAYMEFANGASMAPWVAKYTNLVVLRTLSKAFGLAGLRCGVLIAQNALIKILTGMMMPFPLAILTTEILKQALVPNQLIKMQRQIEYIQQQKQSLLKSLQELPLVKNIWDSQGNFLLMEFEDVTPVLQACQQENILVRHFMGVPNFENYLRVTVGLKAQNQKFIALLQQVN